MRCVLALIGVRNLDLRGRYRNPRPASPGSTTEVEACHPLVELPTRQRYRKLSPGSNDNQPPGMPGQFPGGPGHSQHSAHQPQEMPGAEISPSRAQNARWAVRRTRIPSGIHRVMSPPRALAVAEDAPAGVDRQGRGRSMAPGLPRDEARFSSLTGPQPPKRHPSHLERRRFAPRRLLRVGKNQVII